MANQGDNSEIEIKPKVTEKVSSEGESKSSLTIDDAEAEEELAKLGLSLQHRKKKKKKPKEEKEETDNEKKPSDDSQPWDGTDRDYSYTELLERVFSMIREKNPSLAGARKRHVMPPPQLLRVGTRKVMWTNFNKMCELMRRQPEHVFAFFMSELGTEGSIDGNMRLLIKGRYLPKQIESLLKKYIVEYVTCHMCRNTETSLTRDSVTRLYFLRCESCSSSRSVAPIKAGFHATSKADRRALKNKN